MRVVNNDTGISPFILFLYLCVWCGIVWMACDILKGK